MSDIPKVLNIDVHTREYLRQFEVFFNGVQQRACTIADAEKGMILKFKHAIGSLPVRGRTGKFETETLYGKVEIRRKPNVPAGVDFAKPSELKSDS